MKLKPIAWLAVCLPLCAYGIACADDDKPASTSDAPAAKDKDSSAADADKSADDVKPSTPAARPIPPLLQRRRGLPPPPPGGRRPAGDAVRAGLGAARARGRAAKSPAPSRVPNWPAVLGRGRAASGPGDGA